MPAARARTDSVVCGVGCKAFLCKVPCGEGVELYIHWDAPAVSGGDVSEVASMPPLPATYAVKSYSYPASIAAVR